MSSASLPQVVLSLSMLAVAWLTTPACAQEQIRIGAAHFPPYTVNPERDTGSGLLAQLIQALNALQDTYHFTLVPTSIPRRFRDFNEGRIDMAIFENPDWGWKGIDFVKVDLGLEDAEVFVTHNIEGRGQGYFDSLQGKRLELYSGYHYAFAGFNADARYLQQTFGATLTYSHDSNLMMVQRDRADVALVTRSYLYDFLARHEDYRGQFLASERTDQTYHHYALLRPQAPISGEAFARLLQQLHENGQLQDIFGPYQIGVSAAHSP
ncbi:amino acid ABC transporter substrate-binding protein (PAAT family) [Pseudomonas putida]|uniref:Amino acid ABC transporter substrate-binding protein (PAAT family) n=2 Tax=Pseudomonas putida TaxID=303 RepID=A0A9X8HIB7_PSEPU|nr:amino acid ABC transporter substrate-binding protein (PAAT family) [Pseudomonas putida]